MPRYRVYLMDEAEFVQKTALADCDNDVDAVAYARTLIRRNGTVSLWTDDAIPTALIGWFRPTDEPFSNALVRRFRIRPSSSHAPGTRPIAKQHRMCPA